MLQSIDKEIWAQQQNKMNALERIHQARAVIEDAEIALINADMVIKSLTFAKEQYAKELAEAKEKAESEDVGAEDQQSDE